MHIQLSTYPHCPSFLINALLVGVNKHIHSGPKKLTAHCVLNQQKVENAASTLNMQLHRAALERSMVRCSSHQKKMHWLIFKGIK